MLHINFITDYVCPYCLVAREALHQAMAETGIAAQIITEQTLIHKTNGTHQASTRLRIFLRSLILFSLRRNTSALHSFNSLTITHHLPQ